MHEGPFFLHTGEKGWISKSLGGGWAGCFGGGIGCSDGSAGDSSELVHIGKGDEDICAG